MIEVLGKINDATQTAALWIGGVALFALFQVSMWLGIVRAYRFLKPKYERLRAAEKLLVSVFVIGVCYYGATKSAVRYDGGIKAGANANLVTNDTVNIHWQRDLSGGIYVPESAAVYIDYRLSTDTNGVWTYLAETTVGAWSWSGTVSNATNYDYNVWAYYIPPEPVHTNGVWVYRTMRDRAGANPIPLRSRIEINGKAIATPKEVRRDEEND